MMWPNKNIETLISFMFINSYNNNLWEVTDHLDMHEVCMCQSESGTAAILTERKNKTTHATLSLYTNDT